MSSMPLPTTPPGRVGCSACENATPGSDKTSMSSYLDTLRSVRGSLRGRSALCTTTNLNRKAAEAAAPATSVSVSAGSSPSKQRWYDSLRSRASQLPTPSSPTSMSSTLKRARLFRSSLPFPPELQNQPSRAPPPPLPQLDMSSFQSELQRMSIFGEASDPSFQDTNLQSEDSAPKEALGANMDRPGARELGSPVVLATPKQLKTKPSLAPASDETKNHSPVAAAITKLKLKSALSSAVTDMNPKPKVAFINGPAEEPQDEWVMQCALYYKGSPWQAERTETFSDAAAALSHIALRDMLNGRRRCSNVLLWTGQIPYTTPRTKQTFTVYPQYDGPRRIEIEEKYCLEWAFIAFTDGSKGTKLPPTKSKDLSEEDQRLMAALKNVIQMGYHVDVWTCRDNENWNFDVDCVRDFGRKKMVTERQQNAEAVERRERYEAFIRHGVAGFSQDDIDLLFNKLHQDRPVEEEDDYDYAHDAYEHEADGAQKTRVEPDSELCGFLEHQEEIITDDGADGDCEESSEGPEISIHSEDLDMATRLGD